MPNFTLTPPFLVQPLFTFDPGESVKPLLTLAAPFKTNANFSFDPTETLKPLYHIFPPFVVNPNTFYDPRIFQVTEPDQILKNEVRRVS